MNLSRKRGWLNTPQRTKHIYFFLKIWNGPNCVIDKNRKNFEPKTAAFWNFFAFDRLDLNFRFTDNHQPTHNNTKYNQKIRTSIFTPVMFHLDYELWSSSFPCPCILYNVNKRQIWGIRKPVHCRWWLPSRVSKS